ncbi:Response regulator receiver domain-containing protein [Mucilaginibacter mallensis]|uniref:Response regulator receiver domain-containing protein n=1 Tax=Mucilaginibacter mallensis TaxID=652787 RepID=A0A1H1P6A3_MUCMA|nr:response regulator [Mucilaginibacter mallensis]SDS06169.1 Response regulator receiver domain-containing protein [Mucilaginibacter mallensis]
MSARYKTCLLIDDNYIDNFVTSKILESGNFAENIIILQSPEQAIEALRNGSVHPDFIFLDIRMPEMSGFEFLDEYEKISIENKDAIKIYMLSSSLDPTDIKQSLVNKYVCQFIHKPVTHKGLEEIFSHDLSC